MMHFSVPSMIKSIEKKMEKGNPLSKQELHFLLTQSQRVIDKMQAEIESLRITIENIQKEQKQRSGIILLNGRLS